MTKLTTTFLFLISSIIVFGQTIDEPFSKKKMKKDLEVFKEIRLKANSGLYKYRTKEQIDSIYNWAEREIEKSSSYLDFYNIICKLTDYEGSAHNDTDFPKKYWNSLRKETNGYFPYPIKWIEGKWRINFDKGEIPIGAEIISINGVPIMTIIENLYKYYTTDGENITGKRIGIRTHFARYYRWHYGLTNDFKVQYKISNASTSKTKNIESVGSSDYYKNFSNRYSKSFDQIYYADLQENQKYQYEQIDSSIGVLTVYDFAIGGNENAKEHKTYVAFLDSIFTKIKKENLKNLIVDVRQNGGGTDPNDLATYSYLTQRNFQENNTAWISFQKIPLIRYYNIGIPKFLRPLLVGKYNKEFREEFPVAKNGGFYQDDNSADHIIRNPNQNSFTGNIYLLVSPAIASAGSLFAAMVAGNENTITIGEETMGGYYGHNGHIPLDYKLPKSKIELSFSVVNLEQNVPRKSNQVYERGIIPDYEVSQTYEDFLNNKDTQMAYTLELIKKK